MSPLSSSGGADAGQFGEVDLIETELARIGIQNRWCFEVGASDGVVDSNTKRFREQEWNTVLIEANDREFGKLKQCAAGNVYLVHTLIGPRSLDRILAEAGAPGDLDFGVIDIDGQDFWVWVGMERYRPRLMLVEFSPYCESNHIPALHTDGKGGYNQAGATSIRDLGEAKGYELVSQTYCNILFRRKDVSAK